MYLGLDIGTSVTKAAIFDSAGREIADVSFRTQQVQGPVGWSELNGETVWRAVISAIGAVLKNADAKPADLKGIGVTGVMVGAWLLDDQGRLLRDAILWNDARSHGLVDRILQREPELFSRVFAHSGSVMQFGCTLPVLAWLKENESETLAKARHVLCAKDYIRYRLTGELATDESEAAMAPGSAATRDFHKEQLDLLGIPELAPLFVAVRRGETMAGRVTREAAEATGLLEGTPVAVGTGDTGSCVIGSGCQAPGEAATILGTTCINGIVFDHDVYQPKDNGLLFILPGNRWFKAMPNVAGTVVIDWGMEALGAASGDYEGFGALAASSRAGCNGVVFVPYLSASGVIAPVIEPRARAGYFGLAPHHGRQDMARAIYEGMAYAIRDSFASIGGAVATMRLSGGGARSPFWSQMIADVTGIPVDVPEGSQFGAKGAALCAAVATGAYASLAEACAATYTSRRRHKPDAALEADYAEGYGRYLTARSAALGPLTALQ